MRTVTFVGLLTIADAIKEQHFTGNVLDFMGAILGASIVMDIIDFFKPSKK